jgi:hypothetical protein
VRNAFFAPFSHWKKTVICPDRLRTNILAGGKLDGYGACVLQGTEAARLNVTWEMIGVPGDHHHGASRAVRDLWKHEDMGKFVGGYEAVIPPHDVVMLVVS